MENTLFIGDVPIETTVHRGFSSQPCLITRGYCMECQQTATVQLCQVTSFFLLNVALAVVDEAGGPAVSF